MRRLVVGSAILALAAATLSWATADDQEIARKVAERLKHEQKEGNLQGFDINLKVAEGNVTLKGSVSSTEQKELAVDLAREVDGVQEVVDDLRVKTAAVEADISDSNVASAGTAERSGKTLLSGLLGSVSSRRASEKESARASILDAPSKTKPSDAELARQIAATLKKAKESGSLKRFDIDLSVKDGVAVLDGRVSSGEQAQLASHLARETAGVRDVISHLVVAQKASESGATAKSANFLASKPATPAASRLDRASAADKPDAAQIAEDRRIGDEITQRLQEAKGNGQLKGFGMSVHVENGNVWLKGRVGSAAQQQMALDLARRTVGVRQVINELTVGESASNIAQNLNQLLRTADTEGALRGANLNVKVDGPDVWLTGTISKPEQEQIAVDLARKVPGVRRVISGLELNGVSQASLPMATPIALMLPPVAIPTSRLDKPQSVPAAAPRPSQMAAVTRPESQDLAAVGPAPSLVSVPSMEPAPDVRFTRQAVAGSGVTTALEAAPAVAQNAIVDTVQGVAANVSAPGSNMPVAAMMPVATPARNLPPAAGAYVYYNQYPTTQAPSMPMMAVDQTPRPLGLPQMASYAGAMAVAPVVAISEATGMMPAQLPGPGYAAVPARYDHPSLPGYAWPTYAASPNYAAVTYPKQYSASAWPYIGPFYPYPQVPLGWRKVTLKWDDGWWNLDFKAK